MNIRKKILLTITAIFLLTDLYAADDIKTIDLDTSRLKNKVKAGVSLGYPTGLTAGYRFTDLFELNAILGTDYDSFVGGMNGLFTVARLKVEGELFPVSIGPAVLYDVHDHSHDDSSDKWHDKDHGHLDLLCVIRFEYDFEDIPLNLFVEGGAGIRVLEHVDPAGSFAIGVRYIF